MNNIAEPSFFKALVTLMNQHPETYEILGEVDMSLGIIMTNPDGEDLRICIPFEELGCADVSLIKDGDETSCDCWLEGDLAAWQSMFDNIVEIGTATGRQTISSLTLVGDQIRVRGVDPMGVDRFFRFNQTVQQFFDGASQIALVEA